jgi:uncharacterized Zn finger protein
MVIRHGLLARLAAAGHAPDRVEILVDERLIDAAVRAAGDGEEYEVRDAVLMRLMSAAQASHSDWVTRIARRKAARIMDAGTQVRMNSPPSG